MFTILALPKPFIGHIGVIQRNAIRSWLQLRPRPQVILFGNEEGTAEIAAELGLEHVPDPACNEYGTPLLPSVFAIAEERTKNDILCYSNCDILLLDDMMTAIRRAADAFDRFLLVGECMNLDVKTPIDFDNDKWEIDLREETRRRGKRRGVNADYFVFTRGLFRQAPPLILGRAYFDNWIMWDARRRGIPVVDATGTATAIHQNHYYAAVPGETAHSHNGYEAQENLLLLGGKPHIYWIYDASHHVTDRGVRRSIAGTLLVRRRWIGLRKRIIYALFDTLKTLGLRRG